MPAWIVKYYAKIIEYVIILALAVGLGWAIFEWGVTTGELKCSKNQVIEVIAEAKLSNESEKKISDSAALVARLVGKIEGNSASQAKAIEEYVKNNPRFINCGIDDAGVREWNRENQGSSSDVPSGIDNKVSTSTITK